MGFWERVLSSKRASPTPPTEPKSTAASPVANRSYKIGEYLTADEEHFIKTLTTCPDCRSGGFVRKECGTQDPVWRCDGACCGSTLSYVDGLGYQRTSDASPDRWLGSKEPGKK